MGLFTIIRTFQRLTAAGNFDSAPLGGWYERGTAGDEVLNPSTFYT